MPIDDLARMNLHRRLDSVLGREDADTLMALLPTPASACQAASNVARQLAPTMSAEFAVECQETRTHLTLALNRQLQVMFTGMMVWSTVLLLYARYVL